MSEFIIKKLPYDLPSNASLALVGQYFNRMGISQRIGPKFPISGCVEQAGVATSEISNRRCQTSQKSLQAELLGVAGGLGRRFHEILRK